MVIMRIHRDTFPRTDHGYTWVECIWFERDGVRVSPLIPASGCCERLGHMPGGPIVCDIGAEQRHYAPDGVARIEKSESLHDQAFYQVGTVCIVPAPERQEDRPVNRSRLSLKEVQP
jgi:hypothetical protein